MLKKSEYHVGFSQRFVVVVAMEYRSQQSSELLAPSLTRSLYPTLQFFPR